MSNQRCPCRLRGQRSRFPRRRPGLPRSSGKERLCWHQLCISTSSSKSPTSQRFHFRQLVLNCVKTIHFAACQSQFQDLRTPGTRPVRAGPSRRCLPGGAAGRRARRPPPRPWRPRAGPAPAQGRPPDRHAPDLRIFPLLFHLASANPILFFLFFLYRLALMLCLRITNVILSCNYVVRTS